MGKIIYTIVIVILSLILFLILYFGIKHILSLSNKSNKKIQILADNCIPSCDGKNCGDNGCGGTCGICTSTEYCKDGVCNVSVKKCFGDKEDVFGGEKYDNKCPMDCCDGLKPCFGWGRGDKNGYFCQRECRNAWRQPRCCNPNSFGDYPCPKKCQKYCDYEG
jgi:hypothetical protein